MNDDTGLGSAARGLAAAALAGLHTRLELGAVEIQEARLRYAQRAIAAAVALFLLGHGLVVALLALAWWAGPESAAAVLGAGAALLLGAAALAFARWRRFVIEQPPLLGATLAQLRADTQTLAGERPS